MERKFFDIIYDWEVDNISGDELYGKILLLFDVKNNDRTEESIGNSYSGTTCN